MAFVRTPEARFNNLHNFPYSPNYVTIEGLRLAYIDEKTPNYINGKSHTFLCLHGVPTYGYIYRNIIPVLLSSNSSHNNGVRVICPDFIGFGRSDKPTSKNASIHSLKFHRDSIIQLITRLNLSNITLIVQDWGGLIGLCIPMHFNTNTTTLINRIILFNTFICDGSNISKGFMNWRNYSSNIKTNLNPGKIVHSSARDKSKGSKYGGLTNNEINAYNAPFPDETYKSALRTFPQMVAINPTDNGMHIWRQTWFFMENNKNKKDSDQSKINIFMAHGSRDVVFTNSIAIKLFHKLISSKYDPTLGITMEIGGILWVPDGSHFLQESKSIKWIINKALKYFGDIAYEPVEYEWILSPKSNTNKGPIARILKISLNHKNVHPLTSSVISGIMNALDYAEKNKYCRGVILTAFNKKRILSKKKLIFCAGLDLKTFQKNDPVLSRDYTLSYTCLWKKGHSFSKPLVTAVNGEAIAGGALVALFGDYIIGYNRTNIQMLEAQIGLGCSESMVAVVERVTGSKWSAQYVLQTAIPFYGKKALKYNLLNKIVEDENIMLNKDIYGSYDKNLMNASIDILENEYFNGQYFGASAAKRHCRQFIIKLFDEEIKYIKKSKVKNYKNGGFASSDVQKYINKKKKKKKK
eukprot:377983_1